MLPLSLVATTYPTPPFILLPPFLSKTLLENPARSPDETFFLALDAIKAFDEAHKNDAEYPSAMTSCLNVLVFLWAASTKKMTALSQIADSDDAALQLWGKSMHAARITTSVSTGNQGNGQANSQVMQQLNLSVQKQTDLIERLDSAKQSDNDAKKAKFTDLTDSTRNLILNASSSNGEVTPGTPNKLCAEFYSKKTASKARDFLQDSLTNTFSCIVSLDQGMATALYSGAFLRERDDVWS